MKTYYAGNTGIIDREENILNLGIARLMSYYYIEAELFGCQAMFDLCLERNKMKEKKVELFLDSGAFSAHTKGVEIDIQEYITFIKKHKKYLQVYANLDVIGDAEATLENQKIMEAAGLKPLPCFHRKEDWKYLKHYVDNYDYVALGGVALAKDRSQLDTWFDKAFTEFLCGDDGMPKVKIHGFGITALRDLLKYPWYSVDSTSWVVASRTGVVYVPRMRNGQWVYDEKCWKVAVSKRSPAAKQKNQHLDSFPAMEKAIILQYFAEKGYALGKSRFRMVDSNRELKGNERWFGKENNGWRTIEVVSERGLSNDYRYRDELNVAYFVDLEASMPKWPWPYKPTRKRTRLGV